MLVGVLSSATHTLHRSAFAQGDAASTATAAFPPAPSSAPAPVTTPAPATKPAPVAAPAPSPQATAPQTSGPPYPAPRPDAENYRREPSPPPPTDPGESYTPPPPPPRDPNKSSPIPDISVRIDPFNFLLEGRLGLELETELYKFLTLELIPVFVTTHSPPTLNYSSYEDSIITQSSNGIGALSGAAIDAGIWFGAKPFRGNVLRFGLSNYAYTYDTKDDGAAIDRVSHTDRQFFVMFGQHNRWGAFTIAGGIGLGYELNKQDRCFDDFGAETSRCPKNERLIRLDNAGNVANLNGFLYPFDLLARFSLGVVF